MWDPTSVGEKTNILYKGVKTSPYRCILKTLKESSKEEAQRGQYLLAVGLSRYKLASKPDTGRCASEEAKPQTWVDSRQRANKDAGPQRGWIGRSHIDWRKEWMPARTLGLKEGWIVRSHIDWEENKTFFIMVWKPLPSRHVLKTLRRISEGKAQRGQYLLAVGLGRYNT